MVICPRGQESLCSRTMIQARMSGAAAAARSSQRRIGWTCQAEWSPELPPTLENGLSEVPYQARNTAMARMTPPTIATISPRSSLSKFTG